jgi:transcriptional regulator with XRE-family HTH domain
MKKRAARLKPIEKLQHREHLGISQNEFSLFCEVSKSNIAMVESGQRLGFVGSPNHIEFLQSFLELGDFRADPEPFSFPTEEEKQILQGLQLALIAKVHNIEQKIRVMAFAYRQAFLRNRFCVILLGKMMDTGSSRYKIVERWQRSAVEKIKTTSPFQQKLLQLEIESIRFKMASIEELLALGEGSSV